MGLQATPLLVGGVPVGLGKSAGRLAAIVVQVIFLGFLALSVLASSSIRMTPSEPLILFAVCLVPVVILLALTRPGVVEH